MHALPQGYDLRPLTTQDLSAAQALLDACESHDAGEPCIHEMDLAVETRSSRFDFARGAWVIVADDGDLAGVGWVFAPGDEGFVTADHYVRPDLRHQALDEVFLDLIEDRAGRHARERSREQQDGGSLPLITYCEPVLESRCDLLLARGFTVVREICQMRLDLADPVPPARHPDGISLRPARLAEDGRLLHAAIEEAFSEHFRRQARTFEDWWSRTAGREGIDPSLWLVAWDGPKVAGQVWALPRGEEVHVESLSVRKAWRGRGLGLALLGEVFGMLAERGYPFVRLFVDAQNETGALGLYLKAGMRVERRFEVFEKAVEQGER